MSMGLSGAGLHIKVFGSFLHCAALALNLSFSLDVAWETLDVKSSSATSLGLQGASLRVLGSRAPRPGLWAFNTKWAETSYFGPHTYIWENNATVVNLYNNLNLV